MAATDETKPPPGPWVARQVARHVDTWDIMLEALKDSAEILFHLGTAGKNPSQDEAIDGVCERVLAAIDKAEGALRAAAS